MKKDQTLKSKGSEVILFPMEYMNITQGVLSTFSHAGSNAIDNAGKDKGIDNVYAPVTMMCKYKDVPRNGNAVFFESTHKVWFADGTLDYATFMFIHDNDTSDIYVGKIVKQGEHFFSEGTAGYATGNHLHLEVAKGRYTKPYIKNSQGTYMLPNNIHPVKAFFIDGTEIINDLGYGFVKHVSSTDELAVGSKVKVRQTALKYVTGQTIPQWVKNTTHTVRQIKGDRILLKEIYSWVYQKDIEVL